MGTRGVTCVEIGLIQYPTHFPVDMAIDHLCEDNVVHQSLRRSLADIAVYAVDRVTVGYI